MAISCSIDQKAAPIKVSKVLFSYLAYPSLAGFVALTCILMDRLGRSHLVIYAMAILGLLVLLACLESRFAMDVRAMPTFRSIKRDFSYVLMNTSTSTVLNLLSGALGLGLLQYLRPSNAVFSQNWLGILAALFLFETLYFPYHWFTHAASGKWIFFWKGHSIHHLTRKVYSSSSLLGHPFFAYFQFEIIRIIPIFILGLSAESALYYCTILSFQIIMSHANLDIRMGWLNYLFVSPETHRFHHAAEGDLQHKNFGTVFTIYDHLLGTFYYHPGTLPQTSGVNDPQYPDSFDLLSSFFFPFRRASRASLTPRSQ